MHLSKMADRKSSVPFVSETAARDALKQYVSEHPNCNSEAATDMIVNKRTSWEAYYYTLETFFETRILSRKSRPYKEGDQIEKGHMPDPWDVLVEPRKMFVQEKQTLEMPKSAVIRSCRKCLGKGYNSCDQCGRRGKVPCSSCQGLGRLKRLTVSSNRPCAECQGMGWRRCTNCTNIGLARCRACDGCGKLRYYMELTVSWNNYMMDYIHNQKTIPRLNILNAYGINVYARQQDLATPLRNFPNPEIENISFFMILKLCNDDFQKNRRIVQQSKVGPYFSDVGSVDGVLRSVKLYISSFCQRQRVRVIPVTEISYTWRNHHGKYYVYGSKPLSVYAPNYPQQLDVNCAVM